MDIKIGRVVPRQINTFEELRKAQNATEQDFNIHTVQKAQETLAALKKANDDIEAQKAMNKEAGPKVFDSGAKSSGQVTRFDLIPRCLLERLARRYELGAAKYGDYNYRQGSKDKAFILDRINHIQQHLNAYLAPISQEEWHDDNLAAIAWGVAFLMELETDPDYYESKLLEIRRERGLKNDKSRTE